MSSDFIAGFAVGGLVVILVWLVFGTATTTKAVEKEDPADWWKNGKNNPYHDD